MFDKIKKTIDNSNDDTIRIVGGVMNCPMGGYQLAIVSNSKNSLSVVESIVKKVNLLSKTSKNLK